MTKLAWRPVAKHISSGAGKVVAIVAGIMTLYGAFKMFSSGPDLDIQAHHSVRSYRYIDSSVYMVYTVDVSLINKGDKAYFPQRYKMRVKYNDDVEIVFKSWPLSDSIYNEPHLGSFKMTVEKSKDLTKINKLEPDGIATGFIAFALKLSTELQRRDFSEFRYIIFEVYDATQKKWESKKKYFTKQEQRTDYFPQGGIEIRKQ